MEVFYILLVLIAGACAPTQAGVNSQLLRLWVGDPVPAAMISFAVGTLALFVVTIVMRIPFPSMSKAAHLPWWIWTGGLMGAFLVAVTIVIAPILGAATMIGFFVAGQMLASLCLDHWGLVGYSVHPINLPRIIGTILLISGVIIIRKF